MSLLVPIPDESQSRTPAYRRLLRATGRLHPQALFQVESIQEPLIALTIDDGPSMRTCEILDLLAQHQCRATFFLHTDAVEREPDGRSSALRMLDEGHEIANHMPEDRASVLLSPAAFAAEFCRAHEVLASLGQEPRFFRAARGWFHAERMLPSLKRLGYYERFILASYLPWDVFLPFPRAYARQLAEGAFPGAIFVFHDGGAQGPGRVNRTLETLALLLPVLSRRGYRLEPLGHVLAHAS